MASNEHQHETLQEVWRSWAFHSTQYPMKSAEIFKLSNTYWQGCGVWGKISDTNLSKISDSIFPKFSTLNPIPALSKFPSPIPDSDSLTWKEWNLDVKINGKHGARQEICFNKSFKWNCTFSTGIINSRVWCTKWSNCTSRVEVGQKNRIPTLSVVSVATSPLALRWMCDSPQTGCAQRTTPHTSGANQQ